MVLAYQIKEPVDSKKLCLKKISLDEPKADEVRIKNHYVAVNHFDVHHRNGQYKLSQFPATLGISGSGEITKIGNTVKNYKKGDLVSYATNFIGSYAEEINIKAQILFSPDKNIPLAAQTAINAPSLLAHALITNVYSVKKNNNVFITGATGGVGNILTQILTSIGVKVYGIVGQDAKISQAKAFGCKHVFNYNNKDFYEEVANATNNQGASVIYDAIGESFYPKAIKILQRTGILVNYGDSSGVIKDMRAMELWQKSLFFVKPHLSIIRGFNLDRIISNDYLFTAITKKNITPHFEIIDFKNIANAHQRIENREVIGNIVAKL